MEALSCALRESLISDRMDQFKNKGRTNELQRDNRRAELLEDYKRKRDILLNEKRGLIDNEFDGNEEWIDWQDASQKYHKKWVNNYCKDQLMLSEWLLDRPCDLDTAWTCVLCPEGQRTLVIAKRGCTRAYNKRGYLVAKFKSILPNGAPSCSCKSKDVVILDCIWRVSTKQLFVLDVLHWNNHPLLNCDAQFRLYWLKSKLIEVKNSNSTGDGVYDVFLPPHCTLANLPAVLAETRPSEVDGVLFFHNSAPYVSGLTPLVGWLKPYMLPERLGIDVPSEYLALKPDDYVDLEQWVAKVSHAHRRSRRKNVQETEISSTEEIEMLEDPINLKEDDSFML